LRSSDALLGMIYCVELLLNDSVLLTSKNLERDEGTAASGNQERNP